MLFAVAVNLADKFLHYLNGCPDAATLDVGLSHTSRSPFKSHIVYSRSGARYQLLRALRAMAKGESMVVERRIPSVSEHLEDGIGRDAWLRSLRSIASWQKPEDMVPVIVPGTSFPRVVGRILIQSGWCAPSAQPHWVPNLRFFILTDAGRESLSLAQAWWSKLTLLERMQAMVFE
jgi:hypothetical protein